MYFVYLIESISTGRYYIGQTKDLEARLKRHNAGYEKYTKAYRPWRLIGSIKIESRKEAINLERKIKGLKKREPQIKYFNQKSPGSEK